VKNIEKVLAVVAILAVGFAIFTSVTNHRKSVSPANNVVLASPAAQSDKPVVSNVQAVLVPNPQEVYEPVAMEVKQENEPVNNATIDSPAIANIIDSSVDNSLVSSEVVSLQPEPIVQVSEPVVNVSIPKLPEPVKPVVAAAPVVQTRKVLQYQTVRMCGQNGCVTQQVPVWVDVPVQPYVQPARNNTYTVRPQPTYNYDYDNGRAFPILGRIFGGR
jgi:hypothetical protein